MPFTVGLGRDADLVATKVTGTPDWSSIKAKEVTLFYPGVISWDYLTNPAKHPGADAIKKNEAFSSAHQVEKIALYALESEYRSQIKTQWVLTGLAWSLFIIAASVAAVRLGRREGAVVTTEDKE